MKSNSCFPGSPSRLLAAALLLPWLPVTAQTVTNPSFSDNNFTVFPGYVGGTSPNGPINGWTATPADRVGQNPASSSPFANNGAIPTGPNVAFVQAGASGVGSLKTTVTDLTPGTKYNVSFRVNARTQGTQNFPWLVFSSDGTGPTVSAEISRVSTVVDATPYRTVAYEFEATASSHEITIANTRTTGDHTLLVDDVSVVPSSGAWSISPWTGDGDSGIDSSYVYTHAFNLGSTTKVTINGVPFIGRQGTLPGVFTWTGLTGSTAFGAGVVQVTGDSGAMAQTFRFDQDPSITLQNLKPSTQYVFTLYGAGWDAPDGTNPHRSATFSSSLGGDKMTVNLNQYGQNQGMKVSYTYTTDALGSPVTISYPRTSVNAGSFHTSGFSNREASPGTPDVAWSVHQWTDDASSGISPNHVYTHAQNYNSAQGENINGVNFTGIGGANPSGTNCAATGLPSGFANDPNAVTGYGAVIARDFLYNGFPTAFTLSGLTPGKQYVFTAYSMGWNDGLREGVFYGAPGESAAILNQDSFGDNQGVRFECLYTADATGTAKIHLAGITDIGGTRSIHIYGSSNREADAMVGVAPAITLQPVGANIGIGSDYTLRVGATGSETLTYQWKLDGDDIPGANEPIYLIEDAETADAGVYTVVIENGVDDVTSQAAAVAVLENVPGVFGTGLGHDGQPLAAGAVDPHYTLIVNPDNTESTTALVQGNIPGAWWPNSGTSKWTGPRTDTAGATAMTVDDGEGLGTYVYRTQIDLTGFDVSTVQISGSWATDNSGLALRVNGTATGITNAVGNTFGALLPFTVNISNAPGLIAGVNTIDFVVNNSDLATGFTGLRIDGLQAIGVIPPNTPPHIAVQPQSAVGTHGGTVNLAVGASGSATLTYQWYKDNNPLPGEEAATLQIPINAVTDGGDYKVRVTNGSGLIDSNVATVTVTNEAPVVTDDNLVTDENTPLAIDVLFDMLDNDTDADNDILTLASFSATSFNGGTVTEDNGIITYTPAPGFDGLDGFTYTVSDGWGGTSAPGTVLITVNAVSNPAPGPLTLAVNLSGGTVTGSFTGSPGTSYTLERSTTLEALSWTPVDTQVAPGSGNVVIIDNSPPPGKAFYRISYTP